jgi:AcrR family transcriptional regulator
VTARDSARQWTTRRGDATRASILSVAVDIGAAEGLEALTVGRLAAALDMSKSGLFAHFGSKEELQIATVQAAREIFVAEVVEPALAAQPGLPRLRALCEAWLLHAERSCKKGGCFFSQAAAEFDARPGLVRDHVAESLREWLLGLEGAVKAAVLAGHLPKNTDATQLAFELNAFVTAADSAGQLFGDKKAFGRARAAISARLERTAPRAVIRQKAP